MAHRCIDAKSLDPKRSEVAPNSRVNSNVLPRDSGNRHLEVRILPSQPRSSVILARRETYRKSPDIPCVSSRLLGLWRQPNSYFGAEEREIRPAVSVREFAISVFASRGGPETHLFYTETRFDNGLADVIPYVRPDKSGASLRAASRTTSQPRACWRSWASTSNWLKTLSGDSVGRRTALGGELPSIDEQPSFPSVPR